MSASRSELKQLALLDERGTPRDAWRVRPSPRARRLAVRVLPGGLVEIVVPRGTRPGTIERFVSRHRQWIETKLDLYRPLATVTGDGLPAEMHFAATGRQYSIEYAAAH